VGGSRECRSESALLTGFPKIDPGQAPLSKPKLSRTRDIRQEPQDIHAKRLETFAIEPPRQAGGAAAVRALALVLRDVQRG
jgi:hypothetical protein